MAEVIPVILAAGLSRRMGKDNKLFLSINGKKMVEHVIDNLLGTKARRIVLVTSELSRDYLSKYIDDRITLVNNDNYQSGMTSSIQCGVKYISDNFESNSYSGFMICLGDQPFILKSTYQSLMDEFNEHRKKNLKAILQPSFNEKRANPVIFSSTYTKEILRHEEPEGCKEIVKQNLSNLYLMDTQDDGVIRDIDTKVDLE